MLAFVFSLLKLNIRVFTVCKTIFILNWTKSECPNFRVSREMEVQFCWEVETGLGKIDFGAIQYLKLVTTLLMKSSDFCSLLSKFYPNNRNYHVPNFYMPLPQTETWKVMQLPNLCKKTTSFLEFLCTAYTMGRSNPMDLP